MIKTTRCLLLVALFVSCAQAQNPRELDPGYAKGETQVLTFGYLDKGQGPTVVFYHPGVDARYWQWAIESVTPSYRAIAMPFDAVAPAALTSVIQAFSLTALIEGIVTGLGVEAPHLVAHSMGGREALELAIARPDLISSLTVIEPALAPDPESQAELVAAAAASDAACPFSNAGDASCALHSFINEPGFYDNAPDFLVELLRRAPALAVPLEALFQPIRPSICDALGEVDMPILFIRGSITPEPIQKSLDAYEACLPEHESATIADSAHYPFVYNPEAFNEILLQFLQAQ
jgi:pimeloyl-ACP methyl ester carboxylesterase